MTSTKLRVLPLAAAFAAAGLAAGSAYAGSCNDPWVTQAVTDALRRPPSGPSAPECNIYLYNNGHWGSYNELRSAVGVYWGMHAYPAQQNYTIQPAGDLQISAASLGYTPAVGSRVTYQGRLYQVSRTIAQGGGNVIVLHLINMDGASVVGPGGASIVIPQGSNYRRH